MKKVIQSLLILLPASIFGQAEFEVSGMVKDQLTDQPLYECHVYLNEHHGVLTKRDGSFKIKVPAEFENADLKITYVGYVSYQKPANTIKNEFQEINLVPEIVMLDDVVVVTPDPWDNFRDALAELYLIYDDRQELYAAILSELNKMEEKEINAQLKDRKNAGISEGWSFMILFSSLALAVAFMIRPLLNINHATQK